MIDAFTIQISFLIYEAVFCLIAAACYAVSSDKIKIRKKIVVSLNVACSLMLICEYSFYAFKGSTTPLDVAIMYIVNAAVYYLIILLMVFYAMLISVRLFERFDLKKDMPCRKRLIAVCAIAAIGMILITVSQFNGIYYYFDENNVYQRGPLFMVASIIPMLGTFLVASMVIQFREKMSFGQQFVLISYLIFPLAGGIFQVLFYGNSLLNICIGISVLLMFFENVINKEKEVIKASKTEVRTGLANEHGYIEWLNAMKGNKDLMDYAVVFFDLRKFSDINRNYGIENGNRVLAAFSVKMLKYIKKDEILGRQFGNQFVAIVRKSNLDSLLKVLKGVDVVFTDIITKQETRVNLSARAGIYMIDRTDLEGEDILVFAGQALNAAKSTKNDDVVWLTQELMDSIAEKKKLESEIGFGLNNNEFKPFYQPKVNSMTGRMCGAEALSRWYHNGEILAPGRYIPIMEPTDNICKLDFAILKATCEDISRWLKEGMNVPQISVNISRRNLDDPNIAKNIDEVVTKAGIPKDLIEIEVTENNDEAAISLLKNFVDSLHDLGYKVSIDDFGSASSSLMLLREINFDTLKIDKGFVDLANQRDLAILTHIARIGKDLKVDIVAEGVERNDQIKTLDNLGINVIQGYYFDKPLSHEDMTDRLKNPVYEI